MSDDVLYIVRTPAADTYHYNRHGGSYIDGRLLGGPDAFLREARSQRPASRHHLGWVLSGIALIDVAAKAVWFYSAQPVLRSALGMRVFLRLLEPDWPGWRLEWMLDPVGTVAGLLPGDAPRSHTRPPTPLVDFAAMQEAAWEAVRDRPDLAGPIGSQGEAVVRRWFEDDHTAVAVIEDRERLHEITFADGTDSALLRAGSDAVAVLRARPHQPIEGGTEARVDSAYWIEPARRRLHYWLRWPFWAPLPLAAGGWERWSLSPMPGGALALLERLGRDPRVMLEASDLDAVRRSARYLLSQNDTRRWKRLEAILADDAFRLSG